MKIPRTMSMAAAGVVALSLGLSACGDSDDSDDKSSSGGGAKFDAANEAVVNPSAKKGGTLRFVNSDDFDSPDPGNTYYAYSNNFLRLYARPLLTYASKPGIEGNKAVPDLAQELGKATDNNKTWTYKLREGLLYEDGSPIKAEDVKYAVARTFDRGVMRNGPSYFTQKLDAKGYKGPYKDKNLDNFKGIETPDDKTVVFKLKEPFADFNEMVMFSGQTAPVPAKKDKGARYGLHPVSSGPYKWDGNYKPGKGGALVRNEHWDASTDPNRKALPDRIEYAAKVEINEVDNRLISGSADVDIAGSGVQAAARKKILTDPKLKALADNPLAGFHWYVPINVKNIPNVECRKAIIYAADRDAMWRAYGADVGGEMATSIIPPSIPGREKGQDFYTQAKVGYKGDVAKAKDALQKCGKPNGFETTMTFRADRDKEKSTAEALEQSLKRAGIKLKLKGYPAGTYTGEQFGSPAFVKKNKIGLGTYGWAADWPTGYGYLQAVSDGAAIVPQGNANPSEWNDPGTNKKWNDVVKLTDPAARDKIYNEIDTTVREQAAILPNVYAKSLTFRPANLTNVYFHKGFGMYDYANLGVTG